MINILRIIFQFSLLLFFTSFFIGCASNEEVKIPEDVISKEKMINVLAEIQLVEGAKAKHIIGLKGNTDVYQYYQSIFDKNEISSDDFETSINFYENHPEILQPMYEKVLEHLNERKANLNKIKE